MSKNSANACSVSKFRVDQYTKRYISKELKSLKFHKPIYDKKKARKRDKEETNEREKTDCKLVKKKLKKKGTNFE
jgi:hypothetical protein